MAAHDDRTELIDGPILYPPVETVDDLYTLAEPGARCLVQAEGVTYMYYDGEWRRMGPPPRRRNWRADAEEEEEG